jgi:hypothetical protein
MTQEKTLYQVNTCYLHQKYSGIKVAIYGALILKIFIKDFFNADANYITHKEKVLVN